MSPSARSVANVLMLGPADGKEAWREWRAETDLDKLDSDCLAVLPLLSGRLSAWLPAEPGNEIVLGICRRGWVQNQLRYREAADTVLLLRQAGVEPTAIFGAAAWALLYGEEKAVRPIETLGLLVSRDLAKHAAQVLRSAGWCEEPGMPALEGQIFDRFAGIWLRSRSGTLWQLAWRLGNVSPELAREQEALPTHVPVEIHGTRVGIPGTEEMLLDALTREQDHLVSWQCDATVLLRNRSVDWQRLRLLARHSPASAGRLDELRAESAVPIPPGILETRPPGLIRRRLSVIRADYRRVSWANNQEMTFGGFAAYLWMRLLHARARTP
jgi:hypothetical protein